ncbi:MAG: ABC transporter permease subunit [Planctomycetales bacterium]|nr:ABC transporter permease subunit [Planctomycetales bacterium]
MWTYILRRLLMMIPTLFGVTIVSFGIMKLAPGDPLLLQLSSSGMAGQSGQTREAFLVQKRDLKLDKPVLVNFRYFTDYRDELRLCAHYASLSLDDVRKEVAQLSAPDIDATLRPRRDFLRHEFRRQLGIKDFDQRLQNPEQQDGVARAILVLTQLYFEDVGANAVPSAMELLDTADETPDGMRLKVGLVRLLNGMVTDPFRYTYSNPPTDAETPQIVATWSIWWSRDQAQFPPIDPDRLEILRKNFADMVAEPSKEKLFEILEAFDRDDMRFFAERLLGPEPNAKTPSLQERFIASLTLSAYVSKPLKVDVAVDATAEEIDQVAANWKSHYDSNKARYQIPLPNKLGRIVTDTQYAHTVWRLVTFNFGRSALRTREPVSEKIWDAVKVSAPLMLLAELLIYGISVPIGVVCAVRRGRVADRLITLSLFMLYSIPSFVAGMLMLLFLCYGDYLKLFPTMGLHASNADSLAFGQWLLDYLWHATLPVVCLSLFSLAAMSMQSRASMLDVLGQDYIRTARAKGLSERVVVFKHALRNSLIPVITLFSNFLPALLGGSVLIEYLFNIPGMGRLSWASIEQKDYPTMMALIYIDAIVVMLSILATDLLYVVADPRISYSGRGEG